MSGRVESLMGGDKKKYRADNRMVLWHKIGGGRGEEEKEEKQKKRATLAVRLVARVFFFFSLLSRSAARGESTRVIKRAGARPALGKPPVKGCIV